MILSDLKAFEKWFHARVGVTYAEAERRASHDLRMDLRTIKAAYAAGMQRGTMEALKLQSPTKP